MRRSLPPSSRSPNRAWRRSDWRRSSWDSPPRKATTCAGFRQRRPRCRRSTSPAPERFIAAVPEGRWTSYGEVAKAAGSPKGAQAVGQWCRREGAAIPFVYRVLTSNGFVAEGFVARPGRLCPTARIEVRRTLADEGVRIDAQGRAAPRQRFTAVRVALDENGCRQQDTLTLQLICRREAAPPRSGTAGEFVPGGLIAPGGVHAESHIGVQMRVTKQSGTSMTVRISGAGGT